MSRTTWRDVLRKDPADRSPLTEEEAMIMMRVAFLLASDYPQALRDMMDRKEDHG